MAAHRGTRARDGQGRQGALVERLAIYPAYARAPESGSIRRCARAVRRASDGRDSLAPIDGCRGPGKPARRTVTALVALPQLDTDSSRRGGGPDTGSTMRSSTLFGSRGDAFHAVCEAADALRAATCGDEVSYVVTRNINYTNICYYRCRFCAFSKGKLSENLRGRPYDLELDEDQRRVAEAWDSRRGGSLPARRHPSRLQRRHLSVAICRAIKEVAPGNPHPRLLAARRSGKARRRSASPVRFSGKLREAGLGSLPGTAAEILDDEVRAVICPDKIDTAQWFDVVEDGASRRPARPRPRSCSAMSMRRALGAASAAAARSAGRPAASPICAAAVRADGDAALSARLCRARPDLPRGRADACGGRLVLHPCVTNIQTSWVKMGAAGAAAALHAGANDLGGTLMNESITRAAGAVHGEEMPPEAMEDVIASRTEARGSERRCTAAFRPTAPRLRSAPLRCAAPHDAGLSTTDGRQTADLIRADA